MLSYILHDCFFVLPFLILVERFWKCWGQNVFRHWDEYATHVVIMLVVNTFGEVLSMDIRFLSRSSETTLSCILSLVYWYVLYALLVRDFTLLL